MRRAIIVTCAAFLAFACKPKADGPATLALEIVGEPELFAPDIASTEHAEVRLTLSPDGRTALWFSRKRPGGPGDYDIWMSRRNGEQWEAATSVSFNSASRDFDPAFSADGAFVYFCSDRPGGRGGDDLYRVAVSADGFGEAENLGSTVNSEGNEFAPMLSADAATLLFSSDRAGGAGRQDLFTARHANGAFEGARPLPGEVNTPGDEFDATFLSDNTTIVFARAPDLRTDRIDLFVATHRNGQYDAGKLLPLPVNDAQRDTYGPMLDWSAPGRFTYSGRRDLARDMDLYRVGYRLPAGQ
jgi:TolB protein